MPPSAFSDLTFETKIRFTCYFLDGNRVRPIRRMRFHLNTQAGAIRIGIDPKSLAVVNLSPNYTFSEGIFNLFLNCPF
jgi:hypothetical protein